jgi:hypothetical protein
LPLAPRSALHAFMPPILFLDFDGVLHPEPCHDHPQFCRVPLFEQAMAQLPEVQIVISSTWRHGRTLEDLRRPFSPALRPRIIGMTPTLKDFVDQVHETLRRYQREAECVQWMLTNAPGTPWIAVDDCPWLFTPLSRRVLEIAAETGLVESDVAAIVKLARSFS